MSDIWDDEREAPDENRPDFDRPGGKNHTYRWRGKDYPRVTHILDMAPGQYLLSWYAKVSALRCAAPLVHAGLYTPDLNDPLKAELEHFVDSEAIRVLDQEDAIKQACEWNLNMREPERYRDLRGNIGSLCHHAVYEVALGLVAPTHDWIPTLCGYADQLQLVDRERIERFAALGKSYESIVEDIAHHALPFVQSAMDWIEKMRPEWEAVGQEAVVVNDSECYAGTMDSLVWYRKDVWEKAGQHWPYPMPKALVETDFKTSGSLSRSYDFQMAAYARGEFIGLMNDHTEHPLPEIHGIAILHIKPQEPSKLARHYIGDEAIDKLFAGFCGLNAYYRVLHDLPPATRSRRYSVHKQKKGARECPI